MIYLEPASPLGDEGALYALFDWGPPHIAVDLARIEEDSVPADGDQAHTRARESDRSQLHRLSSRLLGNRIELLANHGFGSAAN
jgi:hypothetical protein